MEQNVDALDTFRLPSLIVLNPSRSGLNQKVLEYLSSNKRFFSKDLRLIYVSCCIKTLSRDLTVLTNNGYTLKQIEAYDMFAQTDKLEWLAVLTLSSK